VIPLRLLALPGTERFLQPVIAADRVRYVSESIAVVIAASAALAEDGVGAITPRDEVYRDCGDVDTAFRTADYVRRDQFSAIWR
jgi:aerobic carbon-monoxide dehydrogenase large subunit